MEFDREAISLGKVVYRKLEKKYCRPRYGLYLTYDEAEEACNLDSICKYIYDTECNRRNKFNLCDDNAEVKDSTASCIYEKSSSKSSGIKYDCKRFYFKRCLKW